MDRSALSSGKSGNDLFKGTFGTLRRQMRWSGSREFFHSSAYFHDPNPEGVVSPCNRIEGVTHLRGEVSIMVPISHFGR